jgi:metal-responsive CopG/Arc/MetJ family transcriptional regulator
MRTVSIKLPHSLAERITRAADAEGISRSEFLRKAAVERLKPRRKAIQSKPSAYELTADLVGSEESGISDLATNPRYLEGMGAWKK